MIAGRADDDVFIGLTPKDLEELSERKMLTIDLADLNIPGLVALPRGVEISLFSDTKDNMLKTIKSMSCGFKDLT